METGNINIYGKLVAQTGEGKVADTDQIFDKTLGKFQSEINGERENYYTKNEIDSMVEAIKQFNIQIANTLPEASESTMFTIYLIPSSNPKTTNSKDEYITVKSGNAYSWEQVGSTEIDLSGYSTTEQMNAAILSGLNNLSFSTGEKVANLGIDEEPTAGSDNLVKSGGVQNELALGAVYDVSAKNPTAGPNNDGKFESLSALLSDTNLNTLIPTAVRKGGMSIKFVRSSDNKYVQYRLMSDSFSTAVANWQGADDKIEVTSDNLVKSSGIAKAIQSLDFRDSVYDTVLNVDIFKDGYLNCTESPITFNRVLSTGWRSAILAVKAGETYIIKCVSWSASAYGIAIFDKDRKLLSHQDGTNSNVTINIEHDGFLVVNHDSAETPSISVLSTKEIKENLIDWVLSESFRLRGAASYIEGRITSPVNIYYPDESEGVLTLTRNDDGEVTALEATHLNYGIKLVMSIVRDTNGSVTSQSISIVNI